MRRYHHLKDNEAMTGIQYVTDEKGRKVGVRPENTRDHLGRLLGRADFGITPQAKGDTSRKDQGGPYQTRPAA